MNERIRELSELADQMADDKIQMQGEYHPDWHDVRDQFFVELIIKECTDICDRAADNHVNEVMLLMIDKLIIESAKKQAAKLSQSIKEHFGVK